MAAHGAAADALKARHAALQMTLTGKFAAAEAWRVQFCPDGAVKEDELCSEGELCSEEESEFDEEKELQSATLHVEQYLADCAIIERKLSLIGGEDVNGNGDRRRRGEKKEMRSNIQSQQWLLMMA